MLSPQLENSAYCVFSSTAEKWALDLLGSTLWGLHFLAKEKVLSLSLILGLHELYMNSVLTSKMSLDLCLTHP